VIGNPEGAFIGIAKGNTALETQVNAFLKDFKAHQGSTSSATSILRTTRTRSRRWDFRFIFEGVTCANPRTPSRDCSSLDALSRWRGYSDTLVSVWPNLTEERKRIICSIAALA